MKRASGFLGACLLLALAGCSGKDDELRPYAVVRRADVWQAVISDQDRSRLSRLSDAWAQARADVADAGAAAELAALGPVVGDAVTTNPALPTAGVHQCRTIHIGWRQGTPRTASPVQAGAWAPCRLVAQGIVLRLETAPGPQQYLGTLYPDVDRLVFLGTLRLRGDMGRLRYGEDAQRDQLGVLQAVDAGPKARHWRISLPWPQWTARLVLIEIRAA